MKVAALEIPYDGSTTYSACAELTASSVTEDSTTTNANSGLTIGAVSESGGISYVAVSGLLPHRSYCFAVEAVDNAGNVSVVAGNEAEREFFFVNGVAADDMAPASPTIEGGQAFVDYTDSDDINEFKVLGFDGDNTSDLMLTRFGEVELYLSTLSGTSNYPISITSGVNGSIYFATVTATGDFDGDGFDDMVVADPLAPSSDGTGNGGAMHIYFGRNDSSSGSPWWDNAPADDNHATVGADVVLLGAGNSLTSINLGLANTDGVNGAELIFSIPYNSGSPSVYGITGGSRASFTAATMNIVASGPAAGEIAPRVSVRFACLRERVIQVVMQA